MRLVNGEVHSDGKPEFILSGEFHYFRLDPKDWLDRIRKTKAAGCNCIASYIPWLVHEETYRDVDLTGRLRPENNLGAFIDLCATEDMKFIARPGPFTMGEVKNEGIPDWVSDRCPSAVPITWDGKPATSRTLNYLDPAFLAEAERWYENICRVLAPRMQPNGGNIIAVQLDNEIGMLQCWTEQADLSDSTLCEFAEWVQKHRTPAWIEGSYPFDVGDPFERATYLRDGGFASARAFHSDYTEFTRDRFARYAQILRSFCESNGIRDVPFLINIHGSGGGRATTFPIGISQTYKAYSQADEFWPSSDHYLGEITRQNAQDLYFLNAFIRATSRPNQPLSSVEFEAGSGNYGENGAVRYSGSAADFKARISAIQGNRMINHYLIAGGRNPKLIHEKNDGNSRVGTTGGRHGFAAPISPEGALDPVYFDLKDTNHVIQAHKEFFATCQEVYDNVSLAFVPDYYSTDVKRAGPMRDLAGKLEQARGFLESLTRSMLDINLSFPAFNLQDGPVPKGAVVMATSAVLAPEMQDKLLQHVRNGGSLLLYGPIPIESMEGERATTLIDALGITPRRVLQGSPTFHPSLIGAGIAKDSPEFRVWECPLFSASSAEPIFVPVGAEGLAAAKVTYGKGNVLIATAPLPLHRDLWVKLFAELGVRPARRHDHAYGGVILQEAISAAGRALSLVNLDFYDKTLKVAGVAGSVHLGARKALLLAKDLRVGAFRILEATTEVCARSATTLTLRQTFGPSRVVIEGRVQVVSGAAEVAFRDGMSVMTVSAGVGKVVVGR